MKTLIWFDRRKSAGPPMMTVRKRIPLRPAAMRMFGLNTPRPWTASGLNRTKVNIMKTPSSGRMSTTAPPMSPITTMGTKKGPTA